MQLSQVRYFIESARQLNFTRAAATCGVSQPALSRGIKALERHYGGALLYRVPTVALTELGRRVLPFLEQISEAEHMASQQVSTLRDGDVVPVAIGIDSSVNPAITAGWIDDLRGRFRGIALRLSSGTPDELRRDVLANGLDLVVWGMHPGQDDDKLRRVQLACEECVLLHPPGHAYAGNGPIAATLLTGAPDRIRFCETAETLLAQVAPLAPPRHHASTATQFAQLVDAGLGWGLVPPYHPLTAGRQTRRVHEPRMERAIELVYVAGRPHRAAIGRVISLARAGTAA